MLVSAVAYLGKITAFQMSKLQDLKRVLKSHHFGKSSEKPMGSHFQGLQYPLTHPCSNHKQDVSVGEITQTQSGMAEPILLILLNLQQEPT